MTTRLIASMDTGIDDALALAYLLAHHRTQAVSGDPAEHGTCELLGVLATYGNVGAATAARNTRYVLDLFDREDVPVLQSSEHPSWADTFIPDAGCAQFHGTDGLGGHLPRHMAGENAPEADAPVDLSDGERTVSVGGYRPDDPHANPAEGAMPPGGVSTKRSDAPQRSKATTFLIDQVRRYGHELTVLATGPLTDIDAALRIAPDIASKLTLVMMGGSLTQPGNCWDGVAETNIIQDPEAADRVFHSGADITMVGLDVTHQCLLGSACTRQWRDHAANGRTRPQQALRLRFLADIADFSIAANKQADPRLFADGMPLHDPLAAAVALDPTLVGTLDIALQAQTATGDFTGVRGRTTGDPEGLIDPHATRVHVALQVDAPRFVNDFTQTIRML